MPNMHKHVTQVMGMEVRGMPLSAILVPVSRDGARALVEAVQAHVPAVGSPLPEAVR